MVKIYEIKRNGITILLPLGDEPLESDVVLRTFEVPADIIEDDEVVELEDGDYVIHCDNNVLTLKKVEE